MSKLISSKFLTAVIILFLTFYNANAWYCSNCRLFCSVYEQNTGRCPAPDTCTKLEPCLTTTTTPSPTTTANSTFVPPANATVVWCPAYEYFTSGGNCSQPYGESYTLSGIYNMISAITNTMTRDQSFQVQWTTSPRARA